jgi:hypothetical protein
MYKFVLKATKKSNANQLVAHILHGSGEVPKNKKNLGIQFGSKHY